ncbi:MAG: ribosome maturation factor RimP [Pseudomonadota bacterium]
MSTVETKIEKIIEPVLSDMGARLVQIEYKANVLQIMIEGADGSRMGVDDFANISREISPVLEVEDPISGAYRLEISSPGIDRPLKTIADFEKYAGFDTKLEVNPPIDGQKRFRGIVMGVDGDTIRFKTDKDEELEFELARISKAKLVLNDELIQATKDKH